MTQLEQAIRFRLFKAWSPRGAEELTDKEVIRSRIEVFERAVQLERLATFLAEHGHLSYRSMSGRCLLVHVSFEDRGNRRRCEI